MQALRGEVGRPVADKLVCFEAIRGLASLAVLVSHTLLGFWPGLYFRQGLGWHEFPAWMQLLARFPGRFLWDGQMAVALFFVLSGFVLSLTYLREGSTSVLGSAAVRRYPRLMLPVAASVLLAFILLITGATCNQAAVRWMNEVQGLQLTGKEAPGWSNIWLTCFYNFSPDYREALREGGWGAFISPALYNPVLWTMPIELKGSFLVYGFLALFGGLRNRWLLYAILGGLLVLGKEFFFLEFLLGMALCEVWVYNQKVWRKALPLAPALVVAGVGLFAVPWKPLTAFLVVAATAASPGLQQWLSGRWLAFLGRISFGLYLVHMPVLCSLGCGVYLIGCRELGWTHATGALVGTLATVVGSLAGAWVFTQVVDGPTLAVTRWMDVWLFRAAASAKPQAAEGAKRQAEDRVERAA
jgi:peptidoglycan/LPS O-acetylase OafA/YrhL